MAVQFANAGLHHDALTCFTKAPARKLGEQLKSLTLAEARPIFAALSGEIARLRARLSALKSLVDAAGAEDGAVQARAREDLRRLTREDALLPNRISGLMLSSGNEEAAVVLRAAMMHMRTTELYGAVVAAAEPERAEEVRSGVLEQRAVIAAQAAPLMSKASPASVPVLAFVNASCDYMLHKGRSADAAAAAAAHAAEAEAALDAEEETEKEEALRLLQQLKGFIK